MAMWQWWTRYQIKERYALNQIRLDNQMRSINSIKALNNISHSHLEHSVFYVILCYGCEFMYLSISIIKSILVRVHNAFIYINMYPAFYSFKWMATNLRDQRFIFQMLLFGWALNAKIPKARLLYLIACSTIILSCLPHCCYHFIIIITIFFCNLILSHRTDF